MGACQDDAVAVEVEAAVSNKSAHSILEAIADLAIVAEMHIQLAKKASKTSRAAGTLLHHLQINLVDVEGQAPQVATRTVREAVLSRSTNVTSFSHIAL